MDKKEKAKIYFEELRKLVKKCPKGYKLIYDIDKGLFMVPQNAKFDHGSSCDASLIVVNAGNYHPHKSDSDGYVVIVAKEIEQEYVDLAAASGRAEIETEMELMEFITNQ